MNSLHAAIARERDLQARLRAVDWTESLYTRFAAHTFRTVFVPLSIDEARAMVSHHQSQSNSESNVSLASSLPSSLSTLRAKLATAIDSLQVESNGVFAKLSSRSPKDSTVAQRRALPLVCDAIRQHRARGGRVAAAVVVDAIMNATIASLRCRTAEEVLDLFLTSDRVCADDLPLALQFPASWSQCIVVRQFVPFPAHHEFRAFVMDTKLTALCQYFDMAAYPELIRDRERIAALVRAFFDSVPPSDWPGREFSIDLAVDVERQVVTVVEFNPFGRPDGLGTGTVLFNTRNEHDCGVLFGDAPFECRVVEEAPFATLESLKLRGELADWLVNEGYWNETQ
jgi:hypothetical protein